MHIFIEVIRRGEKLYFAGFGILVNVAGIIVGGTLSIILKVNADDTIETVGTMMMITSLAIGSLTGELININGHIEKFGT